MLIQSRYARSGLFAVTVILTPSVCWAQKDVQVPEGAETIELPNASFAVQQCIDLTQGGKRRGVLNVYDVKNGSDMYFKATPKASDADLDAYLWDEPKQKDPVSKDDMQDSIAEINYRTPSSPDYRSYKLVVFNFKDHETTYELCSSVTK